MSSEKNDQAPPAGDQTSRKLAHDLNNIFGAISGYAQFIVEDSPPGSLQADYARRILAATDSGAALAKRLALEANGKG